jgi:hypothetical protein
MLTTARLQKLRDEYATWRERARKEGFTCITMSDNEVPSTPESWVRAAQDVYWDTCANDQYDDEPEGPGYTEPWEVAYGPRGF